MNQFWCISCKKGFQKESIKKELVNCPFCHTHEYVKWQKLKQPGSQPKTKDDIINNLNRVNSRLINEKRRLNETLQLKKFFMVHEHNIVAALRKYCPTKEQFEEVLKIAKRNTIEQKSELYKQLLTKGQITSSFSDFKFKQKNPRQTRKNGSKDSKRKVLGDKQIQ